MRSSWQLLVAIMLFVVPFAGCLGGDEPAEEPAAGAASTNMSATGVNETVDTGASEMPSDIGHQPHMHDYWTGKERVTLMDDDVEVDPFTAFAFTFFDVARGTPGVGGTFVDLPDGAIVYEGTGQLEITVSWTDATVTGMGVSHRSPAEPQFGEAVPVTQAQPVVIPVSPEMCDMPHEKDSRWAFLLVPSQPGQAIVGNLHVKVDIVRMRDIEQFPGHPELFNGAHTLTLFSGPATSKAQNFALQAAGFLSRAEREESGVASEKVVPMESMSMTANVTITSATSNIGKVSDVRFLYKPADSAGRFHMAQVLSADPDAGKYQFAWPMEMRQADSPYAKQSQWRFDLLISSDPTGQGMQTHGLTDASVDYELEVVAYDTLLEGVEPTEERG